MPFMADNHASRLCFEYDSEPYALQRDKTITELAGAKDITVKCSVGHTLYDLRALLALTRGRAPGNYTGFLKLLETYGPPEQPLPAPTVLPPCPEPCSTGRWSGAVMTVPTLSELNYPEPDPSWRRLFPGGEDEGLARLDRWLENGAQVAGFSKPDTDPTAYDPPSTTVISPYLKFGSVSPRLMYFRVEDVCRRFSVREPACSRTLLVLLTARYVCETGCDKAARVFERTVAVARVLLSAGVGDAQLRQNDWEPVRVRSRVNVWGVC
jgi:cryptochrome